MSKIKVNEIVNANGAGSPSFPFGITGVIGLGDIPFKPSLSGTSIALSASYSGDLTLNLNGNNYTIAASSISALQPELILFTVGEFYSGVVYFDPVASEIKAFTTTNSYATRSAAVAAVSAAPVGSYPICTFSAEVTANTLTPTMVFSVVPLAYSINNNIFYQFVSSKTIRSDVIYFPLSQASDITNSALAQNGTTIYLFDNDSSIIKIDTSVVGSLSGVAIGSSYGSERQAAIYNSSNNKLYEFNGNVPVLEWFKYNISGSIETSGSIPDFESGTYGSIGAAAYDALRDIVYILYLGSGGYFGIQAIELDGNTLVGSSFVTNLSTENNSFGEVDLNYDSNADRLWIRSKSTSASLFSQYAIQLSGGGFHSAPTYTRNSALDFNDPYNTSGYQNMVVGTSLNVNQVTSISNVVLEDDIRPLLKDTVKLVYSDFASSNYTHSDASKIFGNVYIDGNLTLNANIIVKGDLVVTGAVIGSGGWTVDGNVVIYGDVRLTTTGAAFSVKGSMYTASSFIVYTTSAGINPNFSVGNGWYAKAGAVLNGINGGSAYNLEVNGYLTSIQNITLSGSYTNSGVGGRGGSFTARGPVTISQGAIVTNGGDSGGGTGGAGGSVYVAGLYSSSTGIATYGGNGTTGGGVGGSVSILGDVYSQSGSINVAGGSSNAASGNNGQVLIYGNANLGSGSLVASNSIALTASNTGSAANCLIFIRGNLHANVLRAEGTSGNTGGSSSVTVEGNLILNGTGSSTLSVRGGNSTTSNGGYALLKVLGNVIIQSGGMNVQGGSATSGTGGSLTLDVFGRVNSAQAVTARGGDSASVGGAITRAKFYAGIFVNGSLITGGGSGVTAGAIGTATSDDVLFIGGSSRMTSLLINAGGTAPSIKKIAFGPGPHSIGTWSVTAGPYSALDVKCAGANGSVSEVGASSQLIIKTLSANNGGTNAVNTDNRIRQSSCGDNILIQGSNSTSTQTLWRSVTLT